MSLSLSFRALPAFLATLLATALLAAPLCADPAPSLQIDPDRVTVSGLSAGGQMAHQLHLAWSDYFGGAAIIAGGPWGCAAGSVATAFARCMATAPADGLPVAEFAEAIRTAAAADEIADPANLADDRVWLFHGTLDTTVAAGVSGALAALYGEFVATDQLNYISDVPASHTFPAKDRGGPCDATQAPFVGNCGYDAAGALLLQLYGELQPPGDGSAGQLLNVDLPGAAEAGLLDTAVLYVPPACANGERACALHLVLHGCAQSTAQVGMAFIEQSGYLDWAASNDIVMAFPQVAASAVNPYACWDWWGYTGSNYLERSAPQMQLLVDWLRSLNA